LQPEYDKNSTSEPVQAVAQMGSRLRLCLKN
jgi:hypothetical protein